MRLLFHYIKKTKGTKICYLFVLFFGFLFVNTYSQDLHFSQFYFAPYNLNPSNNGNFEGDWRLVNNMRSQWGSISPYSTIALAFEHQVMYKQQHFTAGFHILHDRSNYASMNVNGAYLAGAYHKNLLGHHLHGGLQIGYMNVHFPTENVSFPDQYDPSQGHFNSDLGTGEPIYREQFNYLDINVGIGWDKKFGIAKPEVGIAFFHINFPKGSFISEDNTLPIRQVFHAGSRLDIAEKLFLHPRLMYMGRSGASEMIMGSNVGFIFDEYFLERSIFIGWHLRDGFENYDAMIFSAGINYGNWLAAISYDVNMSELKTTQNNPAGFELSIIYRAISTKIKKLTIPCEIY